MNSAGRIFVVLALLFSVSVATAQTSKRPNILLVLVDDLRWDAIRFNQHPFFRPPNIERIANEGAVFNNSFVVHSLCSPSRATILTGLYSHQHGVREIRAVLNPQLPTAPKLLQAAGYETAFLGKWHVSANPRDLQSLYNTDGRPQPGFDFWVSFKGQGEYKNPPLNVNGQEIVAAGHLSDILTDYALEFLSRDRAQPFYLMLSHKAVHDPYVPQDRFLGMYSKINAPLPATYGEDLSNKPDYLRCMLFGGDYQTKVRRYYETLAGVDEGLGRILAKLQEKNILDETLIIFTSDNGLMMGSHNLAGKNVPYEESIHIPLFVRYPKWFQIGTMISNEFTLNIDIVPTMLEAANVPIPKVMPGISLRRFAHGEAHRNSFLYENFRFQLPRAEQESCLPELRAIRTRDYKYVVCLDPKDKEELYDLNKDPLEADNRIKDPAYANILNRLRLQLDSLRLAAGDTSKISAIDHENEELPATFKLFPNRPNPFNATTRIQYALLVPSRVSLKVYNISGQEIATLVDGIEGAGLKSILFDASRLPSGIYFYRFAAGAFVATRKMILVTPSARLKR